MTVTATAHIITGVIAIVLGAFFLKKVVADPEPLDWLGRTMVVLVSLSVIVFGGWTAVT